MEESQKARLLLYVSLTFHYAIPLLCWETGKAADSHASTRERFLDDDDFIFSLRNGFQLRKIVNKLIPGSFYIEDDVEHLDEMKKQNLPDGFSKISELHEDMLIIERKLWNSPINN
ncbi:hypothetical protein Tsp_00116 [Trichinella spiralis]|uniref:hypothetical protein n=1 Tax=Trichinella spiralis TaxID=6334 RepID=UPI0001EFC025|nr:hypothetical protein Tsp_00116 [Trichinella spiralis]